MKISYISLLSSLLVTSPLVLGCELPKFSLNTTGPFPETIGLVTESDKFKPGDYVCTSVTIKNETSDTLTLKHFQKYFAASGDGSKRHGTREFPTRDISVPAGKEETYKFCELIPSHRFIKKGDDSYEFGPYSGYTAGTDSEIKRLPVKQGEENKFSVISEGSSLKIK